MKTATLPNDVAQRLMEISYLVASARRWAAKGKHEQALSRLASARSLAAGVERLGYTAPEISI